MNWSKEWPKPEVAPPRDVKQPWPKQGWMLPAEITIPLAKAITKTGQELLAELAKNQPQEKVYNNKVPTHNPYINPDAHIYYQCDCGAILDPCTKSFAALNNCASDTGWKIRWNKDGSGYQPFCVACGKDVE